MLPGVVLAQTGRHHPDPVIEPRAGAKREQEPRRLQTLQPRELREEAPCLVAAETTLRGYVLSRAQGGTDAKSPLLSAGSAARQTGSGAAAGKRRARSTSKARAEVGGWWAARANTSNPLDSVRNHFARDAAW